MTLIPTWSLVPCPTPVSAPQDSDRLNSFQGLVPSLLVLVYTIVRIRLRQQLHGAAILYFLTVDSMEVEEVSRMLGPLGFPHSALNAMVKVAL